MCVKNPNTEIAFPVAKMYSNTYLKILRIGSILKNWFADSMTSHFNILNVSFSYIKQENTGALRCSGSSNVKEFFKLEI